MIFSHKRTIIFIDKEKIRWAQGKAPAGKILGAVQSLPWSEKNLGLALAEIADKFPKHVRVVIGEEFSYVSSLQKVKGRGTVLSDIQPLIPENLRDGWDSREGNANDVQVMAIQQDFFAILKKTFADTKLKVEAVETESVAVNRSIPAEKNKVVLFARYDGKILLGAARGGLILATKVFSKFPEQEKIKEFMDYLSNRKNISIDSAYVQDKTGDLIKIFKDLNLEVREKSLDPMVGICQKKDINGRDKDVLNIFLNAESNNPENKKEDRKGNKQENGRENKKHMQLREKILLITFLVIIVGGAAFVYRVYKSRQATVVKTKPAVKNTPIDQPGLDWGK